MQYQGICPSGWHLPSDYEWNQLEEVIARSEAGIYSTTGPTTWEPDYSTRFGSRGEHSRKMKSATTAAGNAATNGANNASQQSDAVVRHQMPKAVYRSVRCKKN